MCIYIFTKLNVRLQTCRLPFYDYFLIKNIFKNGVYKSYLTYQTLKLGLALTSILLDSPKWMLGFEFKKLFLKFTP